MPESTTELLIERGKTHGRFEDHAAITQDLKRAYYFHLSQRIQRGQDDLNRMQKESVEMILHKIGRIIAGDPDFIDHWDDIAGYAKNANGTY